METPREFAVILFMLISVSAFCQTRADEIVKSTAMKADSAFADQIEKIKLETSNVQELFRAPASDSEILNKSIVTIETLNDSEVTMRAADVILLYWKGYTDCAIKVNETGKIDYKELEAQVRQLVLAIQKQNGFAKTELGRPKNY